MKNVKDFGAVGNGVANDSVAVQNAINTGESIFFPAGTYLVNVTVNNKTICEGEGSNVTFLKPFDTSTAAVTYASKSPYWTYHSEFRAIGFLSAGKTGVGFTFAKTNPAAYATNDEYANNVKFFGCNFIGFEKGIQFPFGNIGTEFYSCGFHQNKYGVYSLNNKFGGAMHAGNKYFYAGEMSGNDCAVYVHNTQDGFGGLSFKDVIFEANAIATYIYTTSVVGAIVFDGCWNEQNGVSSGTSSFSLDQWSGSTKSTTSFGAHAFIFDGASSIYAMSNMFFSDVYLKASNSKVTATNCRAEYLAGVGAAPCIVDDALSQILLVEPTTDLGIPCSARVLTLGAFTSWKYTIDNISSFSQSRTAVVQHRRTKTSASAGTGISLALNTPAQVGSGSFSPITGTVVADGLLFPACNEWTIPFTAPSQFMSLTGSSLSTSAGWYVATVAIKVTAGTPKFYVWNRDTAQLATAFAAPTNGQWHTFCAIGYSAGGQNLYFDIGGTNASSTVRLSAWQLHRFDSLQEAQQFVRSGTFLQPSSNGTATYDPPALSSGSGVTTSVACPGAALGDVVSVSFSLDLQGVQLSAWVASAGTVSVRFQNGSGSTVDLASGLLYVTASKG